MKKFFAVPLAVLFVAACSDSTTAPVSNASLTPSYAKPGSGGSGVTVTGSLQNDSLIFGAGGDMGVTSATGFTTTLTVEDPLGVSAASAPTELAPSWRDQYVLGQLNNQQVNISIAPGATEYSVSFDLFLIGSWDGKGQQAQHGAFGQDSWQIAAVCSGQVVDVFTTSFSNQKSVQQNYPRSIYDGGGTKYLTGSAGSNVTGFTANVPLFEAVVDSWYTLRFVGTNPCPSGTTFNSIRLSIPQFDLQSRSDETWAIDNLSVKADG